MWTLCVQHPLSRDSIVECFTVCMCKSSSWCQNKTKNETAKHQINKLDIQLMPCESKPSPSVRGLLPPLSFGLWWSCSTASGKRVSFLPPFHSRMPLPSHSPSFSRCHILPHRTPMLFSSSSCCNPSTPLSPQNSPYPSLCDWLLFDNWPLLVLLFEPTIV